MTYAERNASKIKKMAYFFNSQNLKWTSWTQNKMAAIKEHRKEDQQISRKIMHPSCRKLPLILCEHLCWRFVAELPTNKFFFSFLNIFSLFYLTDLWIFNYARITVRPFSRHFSITSRLDTSVSKFKLYSKKNVYHQ